MTGYVFGAPGSGVVRPVGASGQILIASSGTVGQTGATSATVNRPPVGICTLGYSPQEVFPDVATIEALMGRSFSGARRNSAFSTLTWTQNQADYTAGYHTNFRNANWQTTNPSPPPNVLPMGWASVTSGTYDVSNLKPLVDDLLTGGHPWTPANPLLLAIHHEQALDTTNQSGVGTNGTVQDYIDEFRHTRLYLDGRGATAYSVTGQYLGGPLLVYWIMYQASLIGNQLGDPPLSGKTYIDLDPNLGSSHAPAGTSYYDGIGIDHYNNIGTGHLKFGTDASPVLSPLVALATSKGMNFIIPEFGVEDDGLGTTISAEKAAYFTSVRGYLAGLGTIGPGICTFLGCTVGSASNYYPTSSAQSSAAFALFGSDRYYS